jgi:hypothetical protein
MSTPPANNVNKTATKARNEIQVAANASFIAAADLIIADASSRGLHLVRVTLFENVNLQDIVTYYQNLGYVVAAPLPPNVGEQPAQLFGEFWESFWENPTFYFSINGFPAIREIYISWYQNPPEFLEP